MTLVEVLIALAIMGFTVVFVGALYTALVTIPVHEENVKAEAMAKSQMEYVKAQAYIPYDVNNGEPQYQSVTVPPGYFISTEVISLDPKQDGLNNDDGLQKITVRVYKGSDFNGKLLITLIGYKLKQ